MKFKIKIPLKISLSSYYCLKKWNWHIVTDCNQANYWLSRMIFIFSHRSFKNLNTWSNIWICNYSIPLWQNPLIIYLTRWREYDDRIMFWRPSILNFRCSTSGDKPLIERWCRKRSLSRWLRARQDRIFCLGLPWCFWLPARAYWGKLRKLQYHWLLSQRVQWAFSCLDRDFWQ